MKGIANMYNKSFRIYLKHKVPPIAELISSEEAYVDKLGQVVNGFMKEYCNEKSEIRVPDDLKEHDIYLIFGNIEEIYYWHKNILLKGLQEKQHAIYDLSKLFIENEHQFHMYAKYNNNKPISEYLIGTHLDYFDKVKDKLKQRFSIQDYMIEPVQRLPRYQLLLNVIIKHLNENGSPEEAASLAVALDIMKKVNDEANQFIELNGIRNFDGLISDQGKLLHRGTLKCKYNEKLLNLHVFVFKRIILFTEEIKPKKIKSKYSMPRYDFRLQIPINKLHMKELPNRQFCLKLQDPNVNNCNVICAVNCKDEYIKWVQTIKQQLDFQNNLIHDLVHPNTDSEDQREILL